MSRADDGSEVKEITDSEVYIKAVFSPAAMRDFSDLQDMSFLGSPPTSIGSVVTLVKYEMTTARESPTHDYEIILSVGRLSNVASLPGMVLQNSPRAYCDDPRVKEYLQNYDGTELSSQPGLCPSQPSLCPSQPSLCLSQLLNELTNQSSSLSLHNSDSHGRGFQANVGSDLRHIPRLNDVFDMADFVINHADVEILNRAWTSDPQSDESSQHLDIHPDRSTYAGTQDKRHAVTARPDNMCDAGVQVGDSLTHDSDSTSQPDNVQRPSYESSQGIIGSCVAESQGFDTSIVVKEVYSLADSASLVSLRMSHTDTSICESQGFSTDSVGESQGFTTPTVGNIHAGNEKSVVLECSTLSQPHLDTSDIQQSTQLSCQTVTHPPHLPLSPIHEVHDQMSRISRRLDETTDEESDVRVRCRHKYQRDEEEMSQEEGRLEDLKKTVASIDSRDLEVAEVSDGREMRVSRPYVDMLIDDEEDVGTGEAGVLPDREVSSHSVAEHKEKTAAFNNNGRTNGRMSSGVCGNENSATVAGITSLGIERTSAVHPDETGQHGDRSDVADGEGGTTGVGGGAPVKVGEYETHVGRKRKRALYNATTDFFDELPPHGKRINMLETGVASAHASRNLHEVFVERSSEETRVDEALSLGGFKREVPIERDKTFVVSPKLGCLVVSEDVIRSESAESLSRGHEGRVRSQIHDSEEDDDTGSSSDGKLEAVVAIESTCFISAVESPEGFSDSSECREDQRGLEDAPEEVDPGIRKPRVGQCERNFMSAQAVDLILGVNSSRKTRSQVKKLNEVRGEQRYVGGYSQKADQIRVASSKISEMNESDKASDEDVTDRVMLISGRPVVQNEELAESRKLEGVKNGDGINNEFEKRQNDVKKRKNVTSLDDSIRDAVSDDDDDDDDDDDGNREREDEKCYRDRREGSRPPRNNKIRNKYNENNQILAELPSAIKTLELRHRSDDVQSEPRIPETAIMSPKQNSKRRLKLNKTQALIPTEIGSNDQESGNESRATTSRGKSTSQRGRARDPVCHPGVEPHTEGLADGRDNVAEKQNEMLSILNLSPVVENGSTRRELLNSRVSSRGQSTTPRSRGIQRGVNIRDNISRADERRGVDVTETVARTPDLDSDLMTNQSNADRETVAENAARVPCVESGESSATVSNLGRRALVDYPLTQSSDSQPDVENTSVSPDESMHSNKADATQEVSGERRSRRDMTPMNSLPSHQPRRPTPYKPTPPATSLDAILENNDISSDAKKLLSTDIPSHFLSAIYDYYLD